MNEALNFNNLVSTAFPSAVGVTTTIETVRDGFHPTLTIYKAVLSGKGLLAPVEATGTSATEAVVNAKKPYATARRKFDTAQVLSECFRLSNYALDEHYDMVEAFRERLTTCRLADFQSVAATCRKQSQALAQQAAA